MGFIVNGRTASEADDAALRDAMTTSLKADTAVFADNVVTKDEITSSFDANHDGSLQLADIIALRRAVPTAFFDEFDNLLNRYGYNVYAETADLEIVLAERPRSRELRELWSHRRFVLTAVALDGDNLRYADRAFRSDEDVILAALPTAPHAFRLAADHLRHDKHFCLHAVAVNGLALEYFPAEFQRDKEVAMTAIKNDGDALGLLDIEMRADRDIALAAVKWHGLALAYVTAPLDADWEIVRAALNTNGLALRYADVRFSADPAAVLLAVTSDYHALGFAANELLDNPLFMEKAVAINGLALGYASDAVKRDPRVLYAAVSQNPLALVFADPTAVTKEDLIAYFDMNWMPPPDEILNGDAEQIIREWRSFTSYPERFETFGTFISAWLSSRNLGNGGNDRPVALLIYNTEDWNGAFAEYPLVKTLVDSCKFRVVYKEVSTDTEAELAIADACAKSGQKIHTLVFAGHGAANELRFGTDDGVPDETAKLNRGDFNSGVLGDLDGFVDESGQIFLYACSNGSQGERGRNLANHVAKRVPPGVKILSSRIPNNVGNVIVKEDLSLDVEWTWGNPYDASGTKRTGPKTRAYPASPPVSPDGFVTPSK